MDRVSDDHANAASEQVGTLAPASTRGRVPGGNDGRKHGPECDGRVAHGVHALQDVSIPDGDIECGECHGDQQPFLEDFGAPCPTCGGLGHHADPDFYDASDDVNPRREFGTMPRLHGRGRGQL